MYWILQKSENEVFVLCLAELDQIIDKKRDEIDKAKLEQELQGICDSLPDKYQEFAEAFSETCSNELLPLQSGVDHRIELEEPFTPQSCPLYKQLVEELEAARIYIEENLYCGFIVLSSSPFISPILMVRKPGGGLWFCVDYRKLNAVTKKDGYPIPLIDEILEQLAKAKQFTKLDIQ